MSLWSARDRAAQYSRSGAGMVELSPGLIGSSAGATLAGSFVRRGVIGWQEVAGKFYRGGYERDYAATVVDVWQFVPNGASVGSELQAGGQQGGGLQQTDGISGQGSPDLSEEEKQRRRCMGARELVRREAKLGNTLASFQSSITFGTSKLSYMDNHLVGNFMINGREVDVDWLIDINASRLFAPGAPLPNFPVDHGALGRYLGGKSIWVTLQKLAGQTPTNSHLQDQGERNAVMLATLRITYSELFTAGWFKKNCPP